MLVMNVFAIPIVSTAVTFSPARKRQNHEHATWWEPLP